MKKVQVDRVEEAELEEMMEKAEHCLNCGVRLSYLKRKDARRNRGYCCLNCYYAKPPKMAYIEQECGKDVREVVLGYLNRNDNVTRTAELLGVRKQTLYRWMDTLGIKRRVEWR